MTGPGGALFVYRLLRRYVFSFFLGGGWGGKGGWISACGSQYRPSDPVLQRGAGARLTEEADGADLKAEPLVGFPKVIQHDINDGQLVDAGSVDLHHRL